MVRDDDAVVVTAPAVPVVITGAFLASAFLSDDLSIQDYYWTAGFTELVVPSIFAVGDPTTIRLDADPTAVDGFNVDPLTHTNFAVNKTVDTYLGLQTTTGLVPDAYGAGDNPLSSTELFARDQTQAAYTASGVAAIGPTAPGDGVDIVNAAPAWTFDEYEITTDDDPICLLIDDAVGACTDDNDTATTFEVTATGTTATFPNPFSRVDFYAVDFVGADLRLISSDAGASLTDDGTERIWTWALTISAAALYAAVDGPVAAPLDYTGNVYAFGVNDGWGRGPCVGPSITDHQNQRPVSSEHRVFGLA